MRSSNTSPTTTRTVVRFEEDGHRYFIEWPGGKAREVPSVTRVLAIAGPRGEWGYDDEAAALGTKVHKAVALDLRNELDYDALHPVLQGYVNGARNFRKSSGFRVYSPNHVEVAVHCPALGVAGTLDAYGKAWKRRVLVDWKSGSSVDKWMELQTGGYLFLARRVGIVDYDEPVERMIVQLMRDGRFKIHPHKDRSDVAAFAACSTLSNWKIRNGLATIRPEEEEEFTIWQPSQARI